ncbi:hypothetical protein HBB16_13460 [Pseudonocardia sp. MCCB 268]|nr:hypothetical protein [Pseudonocardia cytotoxica]
MTWRCRWCAVSTGDGVPAGPCSPAWSGGGGGKLRNRQGDTLFRRPELFPSGSGSPRRAGAAAAGAAAARHRRDRRPDGWT